MNPVVPVVTRVRRADGVRCVVAASEADSAVYREEVPAAGTLTLPRRTKRQRDREIMRRVYGGSHIPSVS